MMTGARITKYDLELVAVSRCFLQGAAANAEARAMLERFGFVPEEMERGTLLISQAERAFQWEREGRAYNFLSPTPERRVAEARGWYADTRRRYYRACVRRAEEATGWVGRGEASLWSPLRKLTLGSVAGLRQAARIASPRALLQHRAQLRASIALGRGPKPENAPPPKDTALVELAGWYERWRLLAQRVFRDRPDVLAPFGLVPGKAPPRLRGKGAERYGERAGGSLGEAHLEPLSVDDDMPTAPDASSNGVGGGERRLPLVSTR